MTITTSELHVADGLANDFDLGALYYGILLQRRRARGTTVKEHFEYQALVDPNANPLRLPGIEPDDARIDFERGHVTLLDRCLVRRSAFRFAPTAATGQGVGSLQQIFLVIKPKKGSTFQPALGLKWLGGPDLAPRVCPPAGLPPIRIWSTDEWQDSTFVEAEPYTGDIAEWAEALGHRADEVVAHKASQHGEKIEEEHGEREAKVPTLHYEATASGQTPIPVGGADATPQDSAALFSEQRSQSDFASNATRTPKAWKFVLAAIGGITAGWYFLLQPAPSAVTPTQGDAVRQDVRGSAKPQTTRTAPQPVTPNSPTPEPASTDSQEAALERLAQSIVVPVGNSPAERQRIADPKSGFEEQFAILTALLDSAQKGDLVSFDEQSAQLRASRAPSPSWPTESSVERRKFNERLADLINLAVEQNNMKYLGRSVELSQEFLSSHFGHSTAHLNLSLALSQLSRFADAQGPAHHAIYYNPDGINGYFALGLAYAGEGKSQSAKAAFCAALRKSRYSPKTVDFFNDVASGRKYGRTPVAGTMAEAIAQCPSSTWGANLPA